jgi:predicted nucleic acid-binding Zn ribbon protein
MQERTTSYYRCPKYSNWRKKRGRAPSTASDILTRVLSRYGLDEKLKRYQTLSLWSSIVGDEIAKRSKPLAIERGVLSVQVVSSAWAQELSFQKQLILARLRSNPQFGDVRDLRFSVSDSRRS